jgi:transposase InsO family protein
VHVDIEKLGRIPDGGGHKVLGRAAGKRNRRAGVGYAFIHNAVNHHFRLAYSETLADERQETAAGFWQRAQAWFASCGVQVGRVLTDNGSCYRSRDFCYRPRACGPQVDPALPAQTNDKVERFNRTPLEELAYARPYQSEEERLAAFPFWLHSYNHYRGHTALAGLPPASRVTNLSGQYT